MKNELSNTDWYVVRFQETGKEIPEQIKNERQFYRDKISSMNLTLESLEKKLL